MKWFSPVLLPALTRIVQLPALVWTTMKNGRVQLPALVLLPALTRTSAATRTGMDNYENWPSAATRTDSDECCYPH